MKKVIYIAFKTILIGTFLIGCEKTVDIDLQTTPSLVVEGGIERILEEDITIQRIRLSVSNNFNASELPTPIDDANVSVVTEGQTFLFDPVGNGIYTNGTIPLTVGATYRLEINYAGSKYSAEETLVDVAPIEEVSVKFFPESFGSDEGNYPVLNTTDPENSEDYYFWRLNINGMPIINPSPGNNFRVIQSDEFFNGQQLTDYQPYDLQTVVQGDTVELMQFGITKRYFNFLDAFFLSIASNPLLGDPPPATVRGNLINTENPDEQVLGYFYATSISKQSITVE